MREATTATHIVQVGTVGISVSDQDRALEFYEGKLGFEVRLDGSLGDGQRWIEVAPPGAITTIVLVRADQGLVTGVDTQVRFTSTNVQADYDALRDRGIDVDPGILQYPVPMFAFRDQDDNRLVVVERPNE
ncbi:MAG: VOC family protein [Coriobacteriia bacterium]|nr:VOC family protein [Coriobacteriia bacterium]